MDRLPVELLSHIFSFACTDSGFTGCSLSLVSHRIRSCSRLFAYQSVHLPRARHILAFSELMERLPVEERRVKYLHTPCPHLFPARDGDEEDLDGDYDPEQDNESEADVDTDNDSESDSEYSTRSLTSLEQEDIAAEIASFKAPKTDRPPSPPNFVSQVAPEAHTPQTDDALLIALHSILRATSSSLLVLSILWVSEIPVRLEELLPPFALPHLEELHVHRQRWPEASRWNARCPMPSKESETLLPKLKRMYIAGYKEYRHGVVRPGDVLHALAPKLEHLRMPFGHVKVHALTPHDFFESKDPSRVLPYLKSVTIDLDMFGTLLDPPYSSGSYGSLPLPPIPSFDKVMGLLVGSSDGREHVNLEVIQDRERDDYMYDWEARWRDYVDCGGVIRGRDERNGVWYMYQDA